MLSGDYLSSADTLNRKLKAGIAWPRNIVRDRLRAWAKERISAISHVTINEPVVALTFDDGPNPKFTPLLLEVLAKYQARGTFFMVGVMARRHPAIVRQVAEQGHAIGNHTLEHPSLPLITRAERWRQIRSCSRALAPYEQELFRPPFGQYDLRSALDAAFLGYSIIGWNAHAFDWLDHDAEWMANHLIAHLQPGSIICLHDALHYVIEERHADRFPTIRAVDLLLDRMSSKYRFVTVPELLRMGRANRWGFGPVNREILKSFKPNDGSVYSYDDQGESK